MAGSGVDFGDLPREPAPAVVGVSGLHPGFWLVVRCCSKWDKRVREVKMACTCVLLHKGPQHAHTPRTCPQRLGHGASRAGGARRWRARASGRSRGQSPVVCCVLCRLCVREGVREGGRAVVRLYLSGWQRQHFLSHTHSRHTHLVEPEGVVPQEVDEHRVVLGQHAGDDARVPKAVVGVTHLCWC